jgi:hypothetical protein
MVGLFLAGWTVHYWKSIYVMFIFLLGSGAWILDEKHIHKECELSHDTPTDHRKKAINKTRHSSNEDSISESVKKSQVSGDSEERRKKIRYTRFREK